MFVCVSTLQEEYAAQRTNMIGQQQQLREACAAFKEKFTRLSSGPAAPREPISLLAGGSKQVRLTEKPAPTASMRLVIRQLKDFNAVESSAGGQVLPKDSYLFDLQNRHSAGVKNVVRPYADNPITDIQVVYRTDAAQETKEELGLKSEGYTAVSYLCPTPTDQERFVDVNKWAVCLHRTSLVQLYIQRDTKVADPLVALSLLPFESPFVFVSTGRYSAITFDTSVLGKRAPLGSARQIQVGHPLPELCEIDDMITETSYESATWAATFCQDAAGAFEGITSPVTDLFNAMPPALQDRALNAAGGGDAGRERLTLADSQAADKISAYMRNHQSDVQTTGLQLHSFELVCRKQLAKLVWKRLLRSPFILPEDANPHLLALQPFLWTLRRLNVPPLPNTAVLAERSLVSAKDLEECQQAQQQGKAAKLQLEQAKQRAEALAQQCDAAKGQLQQQVQEKDAAAAAQRLPLALEKWPSFRDALRDAQIVNKKPVGADRTVKLLGAHVTSISLTADCKQLQWTSDS